jgi:hypothetical protein
MRSVQRDVMPGDRVIASAPAQVIAVASTAAMSRGVTASLTCGERVEPSDVHDKVGGSDMATLTTTRGGIITPTVLTPPDWAACSPQREPPASSPRRPVAGGLGGLPDEVVAPGWARFVR